MLREMQIKMAELARLGPRSRPIYAYPQVARYSGAGPIDQADSFAPVTPAPVNGISDWVGARP
jgi:feruloyl esterase